MVGSMSLPSRQKQHRIWLLVALLPVGGALFLVVMGPLLPRAPDLYVHLIWSWEVMRCLASGQLPGAAPASRSQRGVWQPRNPPVQPSRSGPERGPRSRVRGSRPRIAGSGTPGSGGSPSRAPYCSWSGCRQDHPWSGLIVLFSPMALFSLIGRAAWSEYLAIPLLWWVLERLLDGKIRAGRDGSAVAALWLMHAPSALMAGCLGGVSLVLHRSRGHTVKLVQLALVGGGLSVALASPYEGVREPRWSGSPDQWYF